MITTTEPRPVFTDLGDMAKKISFAIKQQSEKGIEAVAVHVNPKMKELMDKMAGFTIKSIGKYPVEADANVPIDRFRLRKY